jgi:hypothetical protein
MPEPPIGERALRGKFMLIFRGGAVSRHDLSPSELQAHVEKWYRWSDELARQGRRNAGTALDNPGAAVRGRRSGGTSAWSPTAPTPSRRIW